MTNTSALLSAWETLHPGTPPVGFILRQRDATRWSQLQTLGEGERAPLDPQQEQRALARLNRIANAAFASAGNLGVWLFEFGDAAHAHTVADPLGLHLTPALPTSWRVQLNKHVDTSQAAVWCGTMTWRSGAVDDLFRAVLHAQITAVTLFSLDRPIALCPYDGGVDLFVEDAALRAKLARLA